MRGILEHVSSRYKKFNKEHMMYDDLLQMADNENIHIEELPFSDKFKSAIFYRNEERVFEKPIILINSKKMKQSKWFFLGVELGHYFLHHEISFPFSNSIKLSDEEKKLVARLEDEATYFAQLTFYPDAFLDERFKNKLNRLTFEKMENSSEYNYRLEVATTEAIMKDMEEFTINRLDLSGEILNKLRPTIRRNLRKRLNRYLMHHIGRYIEQQEERDDTFFADHID